MFSGCGRRVVSIQTKYSIISYDSFVMVKKGKRKGVAAAAKKPPVASTTEASVDPLVCSDKELEFVKNQELINDREVERRIAAIQAISNAEIENVVPRLRLLRTYMTNEQLQTSAMQFFKENCPTLLVSRNEKYPFLALRKNSDIFFPINAGDGREVLASVGKVGLTSFDLTRSAIENLHSAALLQIPTLALGEQPEAPFSGHLDLLQTPGATTHRLSMGMTPKTQRLPKHGEMLLSAHGSPLGLYNDKILEAIQESEDGSND